MSGERERSDVGGADWNRSVDVYVGILSDSEHLSVDSSLRTLVVKGGGQDCQTERSRSLLERASVSTVSGHSLCMGNMQLFLTRCLF